jgi:hypothetical protein
MGAEHDFTNDEKEYCGDREYSEATKNLSEAQAQISAARTKLEEASETWLANYPELLMACVAARDHFYEQMQSAMDYDVDMCPGGWIESATVQYIHYGKCPSGGATTPFHMMDKYGPFDHPGSLYDGSSFGSDFKSYCTKPKDSRGVQVEPGPAGFMGEFWRAYNYQFFDGQSNLGNIFGCDIDEIMDNLGDDVGEDREGPTDLSPKEVAANLVYEKVRLSDEQWFQYLYKGANALQARDAENVYLNNVWNLFRTKIKVPAGSGQDLSTGNWATSVGDPCDDPANCGNGIWEVDTSPAPSEWRVVDRVQGMRMNLKYVDARVNGSGYSYNKGPNTMFGNYTLNDAWANSQSNYMGSLSELYYQHGWYDVGYEYGNQYFNLLEASGEPYDTTLRDVMVMAYYSYSTEENRIRNTDFYPSRIVANNDWVDAFHGAYKVAEQAYYLLITRLVELVNAAAEIWCANEETLATYSDNIDLLETSSDASDRAMAARLRSEMEQVEEGTPATLTGDYQRRVLYKEQCFLLSAVHHLAAYKLDQIERPAGGIERDRGADSASSVSAGASLFNVWRPKKLPYHSKPDDPAIDQTYGDGHIANTNACHLIDGDPYAFINRLTQNPNQSALYDMKESDISSLVPAMRFYKVSTDEGSMDETEFLFDSYASQDDVRSISRNLNKRSFGVGLQSFNVKYEGSNFFAVRKSIKAELKLFASSFGDLLKPRSGATGKRYRYVDLALKTGGSSTRGNSRSGEDCSRTIEEENSSRSMLNFRLKALIGWADPNGNTSHLGNKVKDALYDSFVTINLTPTVHNFDIDEFGRVVLTIQYAAYIEEFYDQKEFSIFTNPEILKSQALRRLTYEHWESRCDTEQLNNIKSSYQDLKDQETRDSVSAIIDKMVQRRQIYNIRMTASEMEDYMRHGPFSEGNSSEMLRVNNDTFPEDLQTNIDEAIRRFTSDDANENMGSVASALTVTNPNQEVVSYFYVSDLIDNILEDYHGSMDSLKDGIQTIESKFEQTPYNYKVDDECAKQNLIDQISEFQLNYESFRCILGPIELTQLDRTGETRFVNIGDLPISLKFFVEFLTERLSSKEEAIYTLNRFLNDFINKLVRTFLNDDTCWNFSIAQRATLNQCSVSSYKTQLAGGQFVDEPTAFIKETLGRYGSTREIDGAQHKFYDGRLSVADIVASENQPLLKVSGNSRLPDGGQTAQGVAEEVNYMIYYVARTQPTDLMTGDINFDQSRGIFHYMLGKDRGLIKSVKLKKTSTPGLAEVRFEQSGYDGLKQLLVQYDVNIETYLNVKTFPGCYIFVDPRGFDPASNLIPCHEENLTEYGIGGYYIIVSAEHNVNTSGGTTRIVAKWVNKIGHDEDDPGSDACGTVTSTPVESNSGGERNSCGSRRAIRQEEAGGLGGTRSQGVSISSTMGYEFY